MTDFLSFDSFTAKTNNSHGKIYEVALLKVQR